MELSNANITGFDAAAIALNRKPNTSLNGTKAMSKEEARAAAQDFEAFFLSKMAETMFEGISTDGMAAVMPKKFTAPCWLTNTARQWQKTARSAWPMRLCARFWKCRKWKARALSTDKAQNKRCEMEQAEQQTEMQKKISDYQEILLTFAELLQEENQALRDYNVVRVSEMYEQKAQIVSVYRNLVAYFIKNQHALASMDDEAKATLKQNSLKLDELLRENDLLLKTRMETSKSVIGSIVNVAKMTSKSNSTSYGAQGQFNQPDNQHSAIAVNRTL